MGELRKGKSDNLTVIWGGSMKKRKKNGIGKLTKLKRQWNGGWPFVSKEKPDLRNLILRATWVAEYDTHRTTVQTRVILLQSKEIKRTS